MPRGAVNDRRPDTVPARRLHLPDSRDTAATIASKAGLPEQETWRLLRGNAISCYRLDRYGITRLTSAAATSLTYDLSKSSSLSTRI
jgi:hypothetical protein